MPHIDIGADVTTVGKRLFTSIDELGDPALPTSEKVQDNPILLEWYAKAEFSESQIEEIEKLRETYRPLASLMINDLTFDKMPYGVRSIGRKNKTPERIWHEGRGIYHDIADITIYIKGIGDEKHSGPQSHNYPGYPDNPNRHEHNDRPEGALTQEEAEHEAFNAIILLKRQMQFHNISTIDQAIRMGMVIPLAINNLTELSNSMNILLDKERGGEPSKALSTLCLITPSPTRLSTFQSRNSSAPDSAESKSIPEVEEEYQANKPQIWEKIGGYLRTMNLTKMWFDPLSFHSQNIFIDIKNPSRIFSSDAISILDLTKISDYDSVHYIAFGLMRNDGIRPNILDYYQSSINKESAESYYRNLLPPETPESVIQSIPKLMLIFKPMLCFAIAETMIGDKNINGMNTIDSVTSLPDNLQANLQKHLESLNSNEGTTTEGTFTDISKKSSWLGENYRYIELFIKFLKTGDDSIIRTDQLLGELYLKSQNGTIAQIVNNPKNDFYDKEILQGLTEWSDSNLAYRLQKHQKELELLSNGRKFGSLPDFA